MNDAPRRVIIPTYKRKLFYLGEFIDSILGELFADIERLIIGAGSSDGRR